METKQKKIIIIKTNTINGCVIVGYVKNFDKQKSYPNFVAYNLEYFDNHIILDGLLFDIHKKWRNATHFSLIISGR